MKIIRILLFFTVILTVSSCSSEVSKKKAYPAIGGLQVTHIPLTITDVPKELIEKIHFPYVRFYKTEVHNNTDRPIKIIWFDCYFVRNGAWNAGNALNKVLRTSDFLDWHTHQDIDKDGWIRPGGKAICLVNWHWTNTAGDIPSKWAYIGVDKYGNDYFAEAIVPKIKPEKLK
jgi:hypothetical protein